MDSSHAAALLDDIYNQSMPSWGFVLYRTDYAPENESKWAELVERINQAEYARVCTETEDDGSVTTVAPGSVQQRVWDAFKLEIRADKERYDGVDLDALRRMHTEDIRTREGLPADVDEEDLHAAVWVQEWVILVADTEALTRALQEGWMKAVDAKYKPENHASDGAFRQEYWGWMRVKFGLLHSVWGMLQSLSGDMEEIAPPSEESPYAARVYDGRMRSKGRN